MVGTLQPVEKVIGDVVRVGLGGADLDLFASSVTVARLEGVLLSKL